MLINKCTLHQWSIGYNNFCSHSRMLCQYFSAHYTITFFRIVTLVLILVSALLYRGKISQLMFSLTSYSSICLQQGGKGWWNIDHCQMHCRQLSNPSAVRTTQVECNRTKWNTMFISTIYNALKPKKFKAKILWILNNLISSCTAIQLNILKSSNI